MNDTAALATLTPPAETQLDIETSLAAKLYRDQAAKALRESLKARTAVIRSNWAADPASGQAENYDLDDEAIAAIAGDVADALGRIRILQPRPANPAEIAGLVAAEKAIAARSARPGFFGRLLCKLGRHASRAVIKIPGRDLPDLTGQECRRCGLRTITGPVPSIDANDAKTISRRRRQENKAKKWRDRISTPAKADQDAEA